MKKSTGKWFLESTKKTQVRQLLLRRRSQLGSFFCNNVVTPRTSMQQRLKNVSSDRLIQHGGCSSRTEVSAACFYDVNSKRQEKKKATSSPRRGSASRELAEPARLHQSLRKAQCDKPKIIKSLITQKILKRLKSGLNNEEYPKSKNCYFCEFVLKISSDFTQTFS